MSSAYQPPRPGHYRVSEGVHIVLQHENALAICDYPLKIVPLNPIVAQLLTLCSKEQTGEELAQATKIPLKHIKVLCDQLRWKGLLEAGPPLPPFSWPGVSIVIPTFNRVKGLERCLRSLFLLDYPPECLEIIVVDDASTDETSNMIQGLLKGLMTYSLDVRIIRHEKQQGVGKSRNSGAEAARYELIAYIDSDCVASPDWLRELVAAFQDTHIAAVGGMIRAYERKTLLGRYENVRSSLYMGERSQQVSFKGPLTYLPTANMVVRREAWQKLAGFSPMTQGEDVDFCWRLLQSGARMNYVPGGLVYHDYRTTFDAFLQIRVAYASAEAALLKRHPSERRVLLLPLEQAVFATTIIGGAWYIIWHLWHSLWTGFSSLTFLPTILPLLVAFLLIIFGTFKRLQKVKEYRNAIRVPIVIKATQRSQLAFTYHLSRHVTRYYTLLLLVISVLVPPAFILLFVLCGIVIGVDYVRLRPEMDVGRFALCSLLDDCAYEVGVVWGCIKYAAWKPLVPIIKTRV